MGSVWRGITFGFAGLRPTGDTLAINPVPASCWERLELQVRFRGSRARVRITPGRVEASADPPLTALNPAGERVELTSTSQIFELTRSHPGRSP